MSPLFIVGILFLASPCLSEPEADVKTKCQNDPTCYWWIGQDSPFKQKGAHIKNPASFNTGVSQNNPFFNGVFEKLPPNSGFNKQEEKVDISNNPFFNKEKPIFPTAHPAQIVPSEQKKPDYSSNPFLQNMFTANGSQIKNEGFIGVQPKPFSSIHPLERLGSSKLGDDDEYTLGSSDHTKKCSGENLVCVPVNQCRNGVLPDYLSNGLQGIKNTDQPCDLRSNACCKIFNKDKSQDVNVVVPIFDTRKQQPGSNNSFITTGKSSIPESLIKFGGVPGFSPGLIQVLPVEINNAGEFGSSHLGESTQKPVRDISGSTNNNLFGSTPDYSNYNFEDVRFASSIHGPAYLPPKGGPTPPSPGIPDLEVPVSTYVPSFPTQKPFTVPHPRPFVPSYSPSVNNQYVTPKPKQPFIPEYPSPSTPRPYVPPSTQRPTPPPYRPPSYPSSPFPSQKPYTPSYIPPSPSRPPLQPQPSQPFPSQKPYTPSYIPPSPSRPPLLPQPSQPFPSQKPYTPSYIPSSPSRPPLQPLQPFPSQKPYTPSYIPPNPSRPPIQTQPTKPFPPQKPYTPSYIPPSSSRPPLQPQPSQPFPSQKPYTPSFKPTTNRDYLPPVIPTSSSNVNNQYRPFPSTQKPFYPPQTFKPRPPPTFIPSTSNNYLPPRTPSIITYRPSYRPSPSSFSPFTSPTYKPTPGYSYAPPATTPRPKPTVIYQTSPSIPLSTYSKITPGYTYEKPTPAYTYPKPSPGYSYPKPTPSFEYPTTQRPRPPPTRQPLVPSPSYNIPNYKPSTSGYDYPKPSPSPAIIYTPKITTTPRPSPTSGYEYPKPTPQFNLPSPSATNESPFIRPFPTTKRPRTRPTPSYLPPTSPPRPTPGYTYPKPTPGYNYPKPTPTFEYPDRDGASGNTNNQYIPPPRPTDKDGSDSSDTSVTVRPKPQVRPRPDNRPDQTITNENVVPPAACAAALKCVQEIYCSADGIVSPVPVVLTNEQALSKVPTTVCRDVASGTVGVCCRDPNYKDPWPSANLVNGFDDGQYKEDDSISQYKPSLNDIAQYRPELSRPSRSHSRNTERKEKRENTDYCGLRDGNTSPKGPGPLNANFAEIPWQAMILRDSNRSLLCGGAIIRRNAVLTNAHCVEGIPTSDILVKGGEWKLGIDEEPLPFQIVKVSVIVRHPGYKAGSLVNDLAILILEEKLRPSKNIGTICLPEPNKIPTKNCIVTGWGKRILQLHAKGAVMRSIKVSIMETEQCRETLGNNYQEMMPNYSPNTLCGFSAQDQCKVDYGSALACTNDDSQYVLSGIFAWDTGCKDHNQIGGYVAPDVDWINDCLSKPVKVLRRLNNAH